MAKKPKQKMSKFEIFFNIFSIIFLVGFTCFYGYRMFYYKNQFAPKTNTGEKIILLSNKIKETAITTGEGLYNENSTFVYKGKNVNNYVRYSNMLFRIIKVNKDNTIEMVLDEPLNYLAYDEEKINYNESNIKEYLNDIFYKNIKTNLLVEGTYCSDKITDASNITCNNIETNYVKLPSLTDYLNSKKDNESYLNTENVIWLNNNNNEEVWLLNEGNLSLSKPNELYNVKPVITLTSLAEFNDGNGSIEKPYTMKKDTSYFASYVKIDEDLYRIYDINDNVLKLQANTEYKEGNIKYHFSNTSNKFNLEEGLGEYLNTTIYEELSYKDLLIDCDTYTGSYNSNYKNITEEKVTSKIGLNSAIDPIFNQEKSNYYLSTPYEEKEIYIYNEGVYGVKTNMVRNLSLSICINKDKLTEGKGTENEPYILKSEVQE